MHIQRHIHTSTHVQSTHKRNGDNQAQEPGWERRKKGFVRDLAHTHTQKKISETKPIFTNLKEKIRAHRLPAKLLDYLLRSNKSNINHSETRIERGHDRDDFSAHDVKYFQPQHLLLWYPAKMAEKWPRFGGEWAGMAKLGAGVDNELGGSAPHQCR